MENELKTIEESRILREEGTISSTYPKPVIDEKFKDINYLVFTVVIILMVMVGTLVIDSFHFNSATYKEYSEKTESLKTTQKINQDLLDQNQKNQEIILEQQKQIQQLLSK